MFFKTIRIFIISFYLLFLPIIVRADDSIDTDLSYLEGLEVETSSSLELTLNARHAVIFDRNSKTVLFGKLENETCKIASTTKIMTAIVAIENCNNLNQTVAISSKAAGTGGSRLGLSTNNEVTVHDLLYGLLMVSR